MKNICLAPSITDRSSESIKRYFSEISPLKQLTSDQESDLIVQAQLGSKAAFDRLVEANLRFVISVAKQYQNCGLSLEDLIQEGNIGLMEAVYRFDVNRDNRFLTYAITYIRKNIIDAINKLGRPIRIPNNQQQTLNNIMKAISRFEQKYQRTPDHQEIADMLGMKAEDVADLMAIDAKVASLDKPMGNDEDNNNLIDILEGGSMYADADIMQQSQHEAIHAALNTLPQRNRIILTMYFGIDRSFPLSTNEIALRLNLSCERVRQIIIHSLKELREGQYSALLLSCIA